MRTKRDIQLIRRCWRRFFRKSTMVIPRGSEISFYGLMDHDHLGTAKCECGDQHEIFGWRGFVS